MDISIIIPYHITRGYLWQAVRSCENQIFNGTYELIVQQGFENMTTNINDAIKKANGNYIKLCHEDDILHQSCLQVLFDGIKDFDFVCANSYQPLDEFHPAYKSFIPISVKHLANKNTIHGGTMLYKKDSLIKAGYFPEHLNTGEEYELHLRMLKMGMELGYVDAGVYAYRCHEGQKSTGKKTGQQIIDRYHKIIEIQNKYK